MAGPNYVRKTINVCVYRLDYERLKNLGKTGDKFPEVVHRLLDERESLLLLGAANKKVESHSKKWY